MATKKQDEAAERATIEKQLAEALDAKAKALAEAEKKK